MKNLKNIFLVITLATASSIFAADDAAAILEMGADHHVIDTATHQTVHVDAAQEAAIRAGTATRAQEIGDVVTGDEGDLLTRDHDEDDEGVGFVSAISGKRYDVPQDVADSFTGPDGREHQEAFLTRHAPIEVSSAVAQVVTNHALTEAVSENSKSIVANALDSAVEKITAAGKKGKTIDEIETQLQAIKQMHLDDAVSLAAQAELLSKAIDLVSTVRETADLKEKINALRTEVEKYGNDKSDRHIKNLTTSLDLLSAHLDEIGSKMPPEAPKVHWTTGLKNAVKDFFGRWFGSGKSGEIGTQNSQISPDETALANALNSAPKSFIENIEATVEDGQKRIKTEAAREAALPSLEDNLQMAEDAKEYLEQRANGKKMLSQGYIKFHTEFDPEMYLERMNKLSPEERTDQLERLGRAWGNQGISKEAIAKFNDQQSATTGDTSQLKVNAEGKLVIDNGKHELDLGEKDYEKLGSLFAQEVGGAKAGVDGKLTSGKTVQELDSQRLWLQVTVDAEHLRSQLGVSFDPLYSDMTKILNNPFMYHAFEGEYLDAKQSKKPISAKDAAKVFNEVRSSVNALQDSVDAFKTKTLRAELAKAKVLGETSSVEAVADAQEVFRDADGLSEADREAGYMAFNPDSVELSEEQQALSFLEAEEEKNPGAYLDIAPDEVSLAGQEMLSAEQKALALGLGSKPTAEGITSAQRDAAAEPIKLVEGKVGTLMDDVRQMKDSGVDVSKIDIAYKDFIRKKSTFVRTPTEANYDALELKFNDLFSAAEAAKTNAQEAAQITKESKARGVTDKGAKRDPSIAKKQIEAADAG